MSSRVRDLLLGSPDELRHEPIAKRIRATRGDVTVVDSTRAVLVWRPGRVVPAYAVPAADVEGHVGATALADAALAGYMLLDFGAFDAWYEEDELNVGHPRDPFHRIDILHSSRPVRVERDGVLLAESSRPYLLFETNLPMRSYLPREDVRMELLTPSDRHSFCAYKGRASYWSIDVDGAPRDLAWTYEQPLREAAEITGRIAFYDEHLDVTIDGQRRERPRSRWS